MKYYSEKLNKIYDTAEDLSNAEVEQEQRLAAKVKREAALSNKKKAMASAIEVLDENVTKAVESYNEVNVRAKKIIENAYKEAEDLLKPARQAINEAQKAKYQAVKDFNEEFGPYTVRYTGDKAYTEMKKMSDYLDTLLGDFFCWL